MKIRFIFPCVLLILLGLHWVGLGTGLFVWPSDTVTTNYMYWTVGGLLLTIFGVAMVSLVLLRR